MILKVDLAKDNDLQHVYNVLTLPELFLSSMTDEEIKEFNDGTWKLDTVKWYYLLVQLGEEPVGVIKWQFMTNYSVDCHGYIIPKYWGTGISDEAWKLGFKWFLASTEIKKIIVHTPKACTEVIKAMYRNGWEIEGILTKSIIWRGQLTDLVIMGRSLIEESNG